MPRVALDEETPLFNPCYPLDKNECPCPVLDSSSLSCALVRNECHNIPDLERIQAAQQPPDADHPNYTAMLHGVAHGVTDDAVLSCQHGSRGNQRNNGRRRHLSDVAREANQNRERANRAGRTMRRAAYGVLPAA